MGNQTEKDPVLSDKLYKIGDTVFIIGYFSFMILYYISRQMYRKKWEILIGDKFVDHFFIRTLFIIVSLIGAIICLVACRRNKSKYTSRYVTIIVVYSLLLIMTIAFSISSIPISSSREEVNLPNDKNVTLIWEEQSDGEYLYVCNMHGIFAKKLVDAIIFDHNHDYKFDYYENDDTYTVTTYCTGTNGQTIPWTDEFKLK